MTAVEPRLVRAITGTVKVTFMVSSGALMAMSALLYGSKRPAERFTVHCILVILTTATFSWREEERGGDRQR